MDDEGSLRLTIGQVARRVGVPVRTVRFWSDQGLVGPLARTGSGYRTYNAQAVARLDLVRTLRELGLGLPAVRDLLSQRQTAAEVAAEHVRALDAELRVLRVRRALLQYVATAPATDLEELSVISDLAHLSARERQQLIDDFVERAFAGLPADTPGAGLASGMRLLPPDLPDEPSAAQVSAWLELAGLVQDPTFAARVREIALAGPMATPEHPDAMQVDMGRLQSLGRQALNDNVAPDSPRAGAIVTELLNDGRASGPDRRQVLADRLATFNDSRVEHYWALLAVLNGWPASEPSTPAVEWWISALRTDQRGSA